MKTENRRHTMAAKSLFMLIFSLVLFTSPVRATYFVGLVGWGLQPVCALFMIVSLCRLARHDRRALVVYLVALVLYAGLFVLIRLYGDVVARGHIWPSVFEC